MTIVMILRENTAMVIRPRFISHSKISLLIFVLKEIFSRIRTLAQKGRIFGFRVWVG
jgi:hypothetical protein